MALSDLAVYSEYAYAAMTEVLRQKIELFNAASGGAITLSHSSHQGDFSDTAFFAKVAGLVRRRNSYGSGAVAEKTMAHLVDTMVKIGAGTPPVRLDPGQFKWIQQNPEIAGAALGQQLAVDTLADMLNTAIGVGYAALSQTSAIVHDATGFVSPEDKMSFLNLNKAQAKFGDQASQLVAWIMHSKSAFDLYNANLANASNLFTYGTVNVLRDPFGKLLIMTDAPALFGDEAGGVGVDYYYTLGLVPGAIIVGQNNDYTANEEAKNGDENITRTFQAEWSYQMGIKGYAWDKANGGKSPTDAALLTSTNWDKYATSNKDLAGVVIKTK